MIPPIGTARKLSTPWGRERRRATARRGLWKQAGQPRGFCRRTEPSFRANHWENAELTWTHAIAGPGDGYMARLSEYLSEEEFNALEEVCEDRNLPIAEAPRQRLIELGYIEETSKGLRCTSAGEMRLAFGKWGP